MRVGLILSLGSYHLVGAFWFTSGCLGARLSIDGLLFSSIAPAMRTLSCLPLPPTLTKLRFISRLSMSKNGNMCISVMHPVMLCSFASSFVVWECMSWFSSLSRFSTISPCGCSGLRWWIVVSVLISGFGSSSELRFFVICPP